MRLFRYGKWLFLWIFQRRVFSVPSPRSHSRMRGRAGAGAGAGLTRGGQGAAFLGGKPADKCRPASLHLSSGQLCARLDFAACWCQLQFQRDGTLHPLLCCPGHSTFAEESLCRLLGLNCCPAQRLGEQSGGSYPEMMATASFRKGPARSFHAKDASWEGILTSCLR